MTVREIHLGGQHGSMAGRFAFVSDEDCELVSAHNWHATKKRRTFYAYTTTRRVDGSRVRVPMHRLVTEFRWSVVDHKDHNGLNNVRGNLRDGSEHNQKGMLSNLGSTSDFVGVSWSRERGKWVAHVVGADAKRKNLGRYLDESAAARVRDDFVRALPHPEQYVYNFPRIGEQGSS